MDAAVAVGFALSVTYPQAGNPGPWRSALDRASAWGVDAVILADPGLMRYAADKHPDLRLHLSVQGSATTYEAINFYHERFGVRRAVLVNSGSSANA